jgi:hypothetical protein
MRNKEVRQLLRRLKHDGFQVAITGSGHYRIIHPQMRGPVFTGTSPSDCRAIRNIEALLRRKYRDFN